jgi:hypothetical protein
MIEKYTRVRIAAFLALLAGPRAVLQPLCAQDLGSQLRQYAAAEAAAYGEPLLSAWGAALNSGFCHSACLHEPLGFDLQVKISLAQAPPDRRFFQFRMPLQLDVEGEVLVAGRDYPAQVDAATAVGDRGETVVRDFRGREILRLPGGLGLSEAPLVMPQVAIGLPLGVEVIGRFLPTTRVGSAGKVNLFGFGLRYDLSQHLPFLPVDLALSFATQKLGVQDAANAEIVRAGATAYGIMVSRDVLNLTVYGGLQLETSSWTVSAYTARVPSGPGQAAAVPVSSFTVKGKNAARALVGARLLLAVLTLHADYSAGEIPAVTLGAGLAFR